MKVQTLNTLYTIMDMGDGAIVISGDAGRCPTPTKAILLGDIRVGDRMNYRPSEGPWHETHSHTAFVSTSRVVSIEHGLPQNRHQ